MKRETGHYERSSVAGEVVAAFVPHPLPPAAPALEWSGDLQGLLARAEEGLRLLELSGDLIPSVDWFVYAFVRKEAVLSAQIEGTKASLMDLFELEAAGILEPLDDRRMGRTWGFEAYLADLREGTEPMGR